MLYFILRKYQYTEAYMAEKNTADSGFEKQFGTPPAFCAATWMHRNIKVWFWGLIFLKYISDCFEEKYQQLVAVGNGFEG